MGLAHRLPQHERSASSSQFAAIAVACSSLLLALLVGWVPTEERKKIKSALE